MDYENDHAMVNNPPYIALRITEHRKMNTRTPYSNRYTPDKEQEHKELKELIMDEQERNGRC